MQQTTIAAPPPTGTPSTRPTAGQVQPAAIITPAVPFRYGGPLPYGVETILAAAQGRYKLPSLDWEPGYWVVTDKRLGFILFDEEAAWNDAYENDGDYEYGDFSPELWMLDDAKWCPIMFPLNYLHSIRRERVMGDAENTLYLYNGISYIAELGKKENALFMQALYSQIPDLTTVEQTMSDYNPSISMMDPRNPLGERYDSTWPRGYVVADTKKLKKDPHGIDDAVAEAVRAGILPRDFDLAAYGIGREKPPPGVPCTFYATF